MLTMKRTEHTNRNICVYIKISALLIYARTHTVTDTDTDTNAQLQIHFDQQGREQCVSCPGIRLNEKKSWAYFGTLTNDCEKRLAFRLFN